MEKEWPPLEECPQYVYGMIQPFITKFDWEDEEQHPDGTYYYYSSEDDECERKIDYDPKLVKKFLQQVRNSRGYDVDCIPPPFFVSPFREVKLIELTEDKATSDLVDRSIELAINYITKQTHKPYQLKEILKIIDTTNRMLLLTFKAKEADAAPDADPEIFIATVFAPGVGIGDFILEECLIRPSYDAPTL